MIMKKGIVVLVILISMHILQIFLSKAKSKWPGIIMPVINFIVAILISLNGRELGNAIVYFLIMIVPFVINIAIYLTYRNKVQEKSNRELDKMKIEDLN